MSRADHRRHDAELQKLRSEMATKPKESQGFTIALTASAALAEYFALRYDKSWLAWFAGFLFWYAFYDYTKNRNMGSWAKRLMIYGGAGIFLVIAMIGLTHSPLNTPVPPTNLQARVVTLSPMQLKALNLSGALSSFISGRATSAPIPTNQRMDEQNISVLGTYDRQTIEMYQEIYEPQVKTMRDELVREGHSDAQLDAIYEAPRSSEEIRIISQTLEQLGSQNVLASK